MELAHESEKGKSTPLKRTDRTDNSDSLDTYSTPSTSSLIFSPAVTRSRKRKSIVDSSKDSKKRKMDSNDLAAIQEMIKSSQRDTLEGVEKLIYEANNSLGDQLEQLNQKTDAIAKEGEENARDIKVIKNDMESLKDTIKEEIKKEIKGELDSALSENFRSSIAREIERVSMNVVVHGLQTNSKERVSDLLDSVVLIDRQKIEIKRVVPLGKGDPAKSILVELGDQTQRNILLGNLDWKKLPKGVKIEKDCPPAFRAKFKEFKSKSFKYKSFFQVKTQIVFVGAEMILRYKDTEGDKAYTIIDSFTPTPEKAKKISGAGNKTEGGKIASSSVTNDRLDIASCCFIITGIENLNLEELKSEMMQAIGPNQDWIKKVKVVGGKPLVQCHTVEDLEKTIKILKPIFDKNLVTFK